jgi:hypothetical protein
VRKLSRAISEGRRAMRLPRFRVRALMIAVAATAALLGGGLAIKRREAAFQKSADYHYLTYVDTFWSGPPTELIPAHPDDEPSPVQWAKSMAWQEHKSRLMDYHQAMQAKYEHAARYPWLPVALDPPLPE